MHKKPYTLAGLLLFAFPGWSQLQGQYYNYEWNIDRIQYDPVKHEVPKGIKEARYTVIRKGKEVKSVKEYSENGQVVKFYPVDDPHQKRTTTELTYDAHQYLSKATISKKGKNKFTYLYNRLPNGKILTNQKIRYGKTKYKIFTAYNADGNPIEIIRYGKGGEKMTSRVTMEYHDKSNKSKTTLYNSKGKVKKVWLYDCKAEGELQTTKKNENRLCIKKDITGNVLTEVYQNFNSKGQAEKHVHKYHMADTSIFEITRYDSKENLINKNTYDHSFDKPLGHTFYRKGKVKYERKYVYDNGRLVSQTFINKGKQMGRATFTYNENGYMTGNQWYGKKDKPSQAVKIEYVL